MAYVDYPTGADIRAVLLWRAARFTEITGVPPATIAKHSVNDPALLAQVARGRNFTVQTYQRVMDWLDANWPSSTTITAPSSLQLTKKVKPAFCHLTSSS